MAYALVFILKRMVFYTMKLQALCLKFAICS